MREKIETKAGIFHFGFDTEYQTYFLELDLLECTQANVIEWETFFNNLGNYNVVKLTLEREEQ